MYCYFYTKNKNLCLYFVKKPTQRGCMGYVYILQVTSFFQYVHSTATHTAQSKIQLQQFFLKIQS